MTPRWPEQQADGSPGRPKRPAASRPISAGSPGAADAAGTRDQGARTARRVSSEGQGTPRPQPV